MTKTFLQAEWRKLAMANYCVDKKLLAPFLPHKTEIDLWKDNCYVSLVGFRFMDTKLKGFKIPFHTNFEEVNLRFYVRYKDNGAWKRGVVFIKEIVPKRSLTFVANTIYNENYETMPMSHSWQTVDNKLTVEYKWKKKKWNALTVVVDKQANKIGTGSEEEFITEHYWGYTRRKDRQTSEYRVEHPKWDVYPTIDYAIDVDFGDIYGTAFDFLNTETPRSVFLAEGSVIEVKHGRIV